MFQCYIWMFPKRYLTTNHSKISSQQMSYRYKTNKQLLFTTAWRILEYRLEERAFRYVGSCD